MARYALNLPADLKQEAERLAERQGVSLNQFILWAVADKVGTLRQELNDPQFPGVVYRRGASGVPAPVLRSTGIRIQTLAVAREKWQWGLTEIANEYDVPEGQVREALAFYDAHRSEIDHEIEAEEQMMHDDV